MGNLTRDTPKPMLRVNGKSLLEHKLESLPDNVAEIIVVIGYLGEMIEKHLGESYKTNQKNIPIKYVLQSELLGTGHALWEAKEHLNDCRFLVLMGDDLYGKSDLENLVSHDRAMLVQATDAPTKGGLMEIVDGMIVGISEGGEPAEGYIYTGACMIEHQIFDKELERVNPNSREFGLPQTIVRHVGEFPVRAVNAEYWVRITSPGDIEEAEELC